MAPQWLWVVMDRFARWPYARALAARRRQRPNAGSFGGEVAWVVALPSVYAATLAVGRAHGEGLAMGRALRRGGAFSSSPTARKVSPKPRRGLAPSGRRAGDDEECISCCCRVDRVRAGPGADLQGRDH